MSGSRPWPVRPEGTPWGYPGSPAAGRGYGVWDEDVIERERENMMVESNGHGDKVGEPHEGPAAVGDTEGEGTSFPTESRDVQVPNIEKRGVRPEGEVSGGFDPTKDVDVEKVGSDPADYADGAAQGVATSRETPADVERGGGRPGER